MVSTTLDVVLPPQADTIDLHIAAPSQFARRKPGTDHNETRRSLWKGESWADETVVCPQFSACPRFSVSASDAIVAHLAVT